MAELKVKQSTTRTRDVILKPGIVNEIVFEDTRPNYVHINNYGVGKLFVSLKGIPSVDRYDKVVPSFGEALHGEDTGNSRVQIYSENTDNVSIRITSFEAPFDPMILAAPVQTASSGGGGGTAESVSINGFTVPLPSGSNNIGRVVVTEMPAITVEQQPLMAGTNNIGKVDVVTLPSLPAGGSTIGNVGIVGGVTVTSMPPMTLNGDVNLADTNFRILSESTFYTYSNSVSTTEIVVNLPFAVKTFKFISNDDLTNNLLVSFGPTLTTGSQTAQNGVIVLLPGETLQELNVTASTVRFRRLAGSGNVRLLGV